MHFFALGGIENFGLTKFFSGKTVRFLSQIINTINHLLRVKEELERFVKY
jgi:hypothetical protein